MIELHEGTDIAESLQYGRQYIEITHDYSSYFKNGELPESARAQSTYYNVTEISTTLGENDQEVGLSLIRNYGDGQYIPVTIGGISAHQTIPVSQDALASYLYFAVDNSFYFNTPQTAEMTVTYFDDGYESIYVDYNAAKCGSSSDISTMYKQKFLVQMRNTRTWKTVAIKFLDATFTGYQNFGADFRLVTGRTPLTVSKVTIRKIP